MDPKVAENPPTETIVVISNNDTLHAIFLFMPEIIAQMGNQKRPENKMSFLKEHTRTNGPREKQIVSKRLRRRRVVDTSLFAQSAYAEGVCVKISEFIPPR